MAIVARLVGLGIGLLAASILFGLLERFWPAIRGERFWRRRGVRTDLAWFAFTPLVGRLIVGFGVFLALIPLLLTAHVTLERSSIEAFVHRDTWMTGQPAWFQVLSILVAGDLLAYWLHRAFHVQPTLWRYHAVHHSSEDLDWLSAVRVHPFNEIGMRGVQGFVLIALGFSAASVATFVPVLTIYAVMLHANVSWSYGPLKYAVASPAFHRWHHTSEDEGLNQNFAGLFPWIDMLFGTFYMPAGRHATEFGVVGGEVPQSFLKQLVYPFRRARPVRLGAASEPAKQ